MQLFKSMTEELYSQHKKILGKYLTKSDIEDADILMKMHEHEKLQEQELINNPI